MPAEIIYQKLNFVNFASNGPPSACEHYISYDSECAALAGGRARLWRRVEKEEEEEEEEEEVENCLAAPSQLQSAAAILSPTNNRHNCHWAIF